MTRSVALVTYDPASPDVHPDPELDALAAAVRALGLDVETPAWSLPHDWSRHDLVVLKSPWDYSMRSAEFLAWLDDVAQTTAVLNDPWIIRWNFDKRYLAELATHGIPTPQFSNPATHDEAARALAEIPTEKVVIKPTVSAGSRNTGLFRADDPAALALVDRILAIGKVPMVMPALPRVAAEGERSLVLFNGRYSHAARKAPILAEGGGYLHGQYTETITPDEPTDDEVQVAERCLRIVRHLALDAGVDSRRATPLYARIDIARDESGPSVLELELFEPNYFTLPVPAGRARFAQAVMDVLNQNPAGTDA